MNKEKYFCDHCNYKCLYLQQWNKHIQTKKHIINCNLPNKLQDDLTTKCNHCKVVFTNEDYKKHRERNQVYWMVKSNPIYENCRCNDFCYEGKLFNNVETLKEVAESSTSYKARKRYNEKVYDKAVEILANRKQHEHDIMLAEQRRRKKMKELYDRKQEKDNKKIEEKINNITMTITDPSEKAKIYGFKDKCSCGKFKNEPYMTRKKQIEKGIETVLCGEGCDEEVSEEDDLTEFEDLLIQKYRSNLPFQSVCDMCVKGINDEDYSPRLLGECDVEICDCD